MCRASHSPSKQLLHSHMSRILQLSQVIASVKTHSSSSALADKADKMISQKNDMAALNAIRKCMGIIEKVIDITGIQTAAYLKRTPLFLTSST
mmetsp:Transcript_58728/g.70668  ORF Transcript_58728/g.70668 Transcript_58728/m.70668 type:complete len:93 (+) Transcript_58728:301-579(+)